MGTSIFGIGLSGLTAAQAGLLTTSHNISNVNTPNYSRQEVLQGSRFPLLDGQLSEMGAGVNSQISSTVGSINADATGIAELNKRITLATAGAGSGQPPNDLLDQRDALLADLNHQIGATGVQQSDGSFNVYLSNGQALVVGEQSYRLAAVPDGNDPQNLQVGLQTASGVVAFRVSDLQGGALGGLLAYRD